MNDDEPVLTDYPHDRLTRLADAMGAALDAQPGTGDVRAIVLLNDKDNGCVHAHGYPEPTLACHVLMMADVALHLQQLGKALGTRVEIWVNGARMPGSRE